LGLRTVAETTHDHGLLAEACAALGDLISDPDSASREWGRAANLLLDELGDGTRGRFALARAVSLNISSESTFTRLFRIVRDANDHQELLALIDARLPHAASHEERVTLLWERARTLRTVGDRAAALVALEAVTRLVPNHVGALALAGEIHIGLGQFDDAARYLAQLGRLDDAPPKQRLMGAMAAADLFDKKLGRPVFARDILLEVHRSGKSTPPIRERLAQIAIKLEAFPLAIEILGLLLRERDTLAGRIEAARLVLAICRDKLESPARAQGAVDSILAAFPTDPEAVDLVLSGGFPAEHADRWLKVAEQELRLTIEQTPLDATLLSRLAELASRLDDPRTRQACLGALIAIGAGTGALDAELLEIDTQLTHMPTIALDAIALEAISAANDQGPIAELFSQFAPVFAEALGPSLAALGVGKKQRVDPRIGLPLRNEIAAWAGAFGVKDFDLYIGQDVAGDVIAIPGERPSVVVSSTLVAPLTVGGRQSVARELFALCRGTSILRHRSPHEISALVVAACQIGEHPLSAPAYAMKDEFVRLVASAMPRKLRKALAERAYAIQESASDPFEWLVAANSSLDRVGALAAGDISEVLAHLTGQRGRLGVTRELRDRTSRLIAFVVSPSYLELKDTLGLCRR